MAKEIILKPIYPNAGLEAEYRKQLDKLINEMSKSTIYWLTANYRKNTPLLAQDATPAIQTKFLLSRLSKRWIKLFKERADTLAQRFVDKSMMYHDNAMKAMLKKAGFVIDFSMTDTVKDVLQASINANVSLITNIPEQYFAQVEGIVFRNVSGGGDLKQLTDELEHRLTITRKRAALIAKDQNRKASAVINKARQEELGVTEAIWLHSHGGKEPRPDHVAANGKRYNIKDGMFFKANGKHPDEWLMPGEALNCRCSSLSIIPALDKLGKYARYK